MQALWKRFGFYAAIVGCVALFSGAAWYARAPVADESPEVSRQPVSAPISEPVQTPAPEPDFGAPLFGGGHALLREAGIGRLVWSDTLMQWQTHDGVDWHAALGEAVYAAADGVISAAFEDDGLGLVVEIAHEDGFASRYACLGTLSLAREGSRVKKGQVIGTVGDGARDECALPPHLHFTLLLDGEPIDPFGIAAFLDLT